MKTTMVKPILYHGTLMQKGADSQNYTKSIEGAMEPRKSHPGSEAWVFATPDHLVAVAYALKPPISDQSCAQIFSLSVGNGMPPILVFGGDDVAKKFALHPLGMVFELDNSSFKPMSENQKTCEWVSTDPVKNIDLKSVITTENAMTFGVQVMLFEGDYDEYESELRKVRNNGESQIEVVKKMVQNGTMQHLNRDRNLNYLNFESGQLQHAEFLNNPELVFASKSPVPTGATKFSGLGLAAETGRA